jgi:tRNA pseudouridine38-40 synthase
MISRHLKLAGTSSKSSVRIIYDAKVIKDADRIKIELTGNGFLYNMVRIIAGTLVEVGEGKILPQDISKIIEEKDRSKAGRTLPPNGLFLVNVNY